MKWFIFYFAYSLLTKIHGQKSANQILNEYKLSFNRKNPTHLTKNAVNQRWKAWKSIIVNILNHTTSVNLIEMIEELNFSKFSFGIWMI